MGRRSGAATSQTKSERDSSSHNCVVDLKPNPKDQPMPKPLFITLLIAAPVVLGAVSRNVLVALVVLAVILIANPIIWSRS